MAPDENLVAQSIVHQESKPLIANVMLAHLS